MSKRVLLLTVTFLTAFVYKSHACNCESDFNWVRKTFEENDVGFQNVIATKGEQAYAAHNAVFLQKVKAIDNSLACTQTLYEWLKFFRSGHIGIIRLHPGQATGAATTVLSDQEIIKKYKNWESVKVDIPKFEKYISSIPEPGYEGIWESPPYKIGIRKQGTGYVGFIIEADGVYWKKGQVKLKINPAGDKASSTFYLRDHTAREFDNVALIGNNYLQIGNVRLKRLSPQFPANKYLESHFRSVAAQRPYLEELNSTTLLLRVPTFDYSAKKDIDSVILSNKEKILKTENLIIDIRNNGGGSDASFREILPFFYTNPIRAVGVAYFSTPTNNNYLSEVANDTIKGYDESLKKWAKNASEKLNQRLGAYVNLDSTYASILKLDTVYAFPAKVGILINQNNASSAEQFLLTARQSRKVKLFGVTTFGALDISNMVFLKSPCEEFELGYCISRSMRIPEMVVDEKGVQPDYYLDKDIPAHEWVKFVAETLNENQSAARNQ